MERSLRIVTLAVLSLVALVAAGCGGGGGGSKAASPLDDALGYLPKDAPVVFTADTNLSDTQFHNADGLIKKFPFGSQVKSSIANSIENGNSNVDFDKDVRPLLGNQLVVGAPSVRAIQNGNDDFIVSIKAKNEDKLEGVLKKSGAKEDGDSNGAKVFRSRKGKPLAVKDGVLVQADTRSQLDAALKTRDGDGRFTQGDLDKGTAGVPKGGIARVYVDAEALLKADPSSRPALNSKWINSLRGFGATASIQPDGVKVDFKMATEGDLTAADLPIASGSQAPGIVTQPGRFSFGLRGADQVIKFAEATGRAINPGKYGEFQTAKQQIQSRLGIDLDRDLADQLNGDTSVVVGIDGKFAARSELKDPAAFRKTLAKAGPIIPRIVEGAASGAKVSKPKGGLYTISLPDGEKIAFGAVKDVFVVASSPLEATAIAGESTTPPPGGQGALVANADAATIAQQVLARLKATGVFNFGSSLISDTLGDINGSVRAETSGLTGSFELQTK